MSSTTCRYLTALITEGSFSRAAAALDISQPSVSQYLLRLETEAGAELIDRTARPLRLTPAGELFLASEREIERIRETARQQMLDIQAGVRGRVTIGASDYRETFFLPGVLPIFRKRFPLVEVVVAEGRTRELEKMARAGETDFSIVISPLFDERGLETVPLYNERILLAVSESSAIARAHPAVLNPSSGEGEEEFPEIDFSELDREPFIKIKKGQQMDLTYERLCAETGAAPRVVLESESMIAAMALASSGLGAALTTETLVRRAGNAMPLRVFRLSQALPPRTVAAARCLNRRISKAADALLSVMREVAHESFARG